MSQLKANSIDHINMNVKDLGQSVEFYSSLFGFKVRQDQPDRNSKIIGNDQIKLCLYEKPASCAVGGIQHFGINVENFGQVEEICKRLKVKILSVWKWENSRSVYIEDPNGYEIELTEVRGGGI